MDIKDREAIEGLFVKLDDVERQAGPRDAEAETFIAERLGRQPGAPYYMAQTIVMQELALTNQQARIEELERDVDARQRTGEGGFLSRMLGGGSAAAAHAYRPNTESPQGSAGAAGPWGGAARDGGRHGQDPAYRQSSQGYGRGMGGGGFLAGAAQTAMGVAGGVLLGNALGNMFSGDEPTAAGTETAANEPDAGTADDAQAETAADDSGGWFGGDDGGGGFDEI